MILSIERFLNLRVYDVGCFCIWMVISCCLRLCRSRVLICDGDYRVDVLGGRFCIGSYC